MALFGIGALSCNRPTHAAGDLPKPNADLPAPKDGAPQSIILAGGCFWCVEGVFEQLEGVKDAVSGYSGGKKEDANYKAVSAGATDHAEAVKITYDPAKVSYAQLLKVFFATHDPTTKDSQGPDHGRQYRSAIFFANDDEKKVAEAYIKQLNQAKVFANPIVTTLEPLNGFYPAEDYHQDYTRLNPNQPYIQRIALPKVDKVREKFPDQVKKSDEKK